MDTNFLGTQEIAQGEELKRELVEKLAVWLEGKGLGSSYSDRTSIATGIVEAVVSEIPFSSIERHLPLDLLDQVHRGLMTLPLAPEHELHCLLCDHCRENYEFVAQRRGDVRTITESGDSEWRQLKRAGGLYRNELLKALKSSKNIYAVAGELISDVFDEELCSEIEKYAQNGGTFSIIAGPMIEKNQDTDGNAFLDLVAKDNPNIDFFVSDRRQELHFAFSDSIGIIYLEAPHESMIQERYYIDEGEGDNFGHALYISERYDAAFSSPDVRPYRNESDVLLEVEDSLKELSRESAESGLSRFGKYGLLAQKELLSA